MSSTDHVLTMLEKLGISLRKGSQHNLIHLFVKEAEQLHNVLVLLIKENYRLLSMAKTRDEKPMYLLQCSGSLKDYPIFFIWIPYRNHLPSLRGLYPGIEIFEYEHTYQWKTTITNKQTSSPPKFLNLRSSEKQTKNLLDLPRSSQLRFRIRTDGENIDQITADIRFNYRKIEQLLLTTDIGRIPTTIERICGLCCFAHQIAFVGVFEAVIDPDWIIPDTISSVRMLFAEIERIVNHLLWVSMSMMELGIERLFQEGMRIRKDIQLILMIFNSDSNQPVKAFGNEIEFPSALKYKIQNTLQEVWGKVETFLEQVKMHQQIRNLQLIGILSKEDALKHGAVGPLGRASGLDYDLRRLDAYLGYSDMDTPINNYQMFNGDIYSNILVRIIEIENSYRITQDLIEKLPKNKEDLNYSIRDMGEGRYIQRIEAPAGALSYILSVNSNNSLSDLHISIPTLINFPSIIKQVESAKLCYLPLILKNVEMGLDPLESIVLEDTDSSEVRVLRNTEFRDIARQAIQNKEIMKIFK